MLNKRNQTQRSSKPWDGTPTKLKLGQYEHLCKNSGRGWGHSVPGLDDGYESIFHLWVFFKFCICVSECMLYSHVYMECVYSFCYFIFNKNEFCAYFCCYPLKMQVGKSYAPTFSRLYLFLNLALCSQKVWSEESFKTGTLLEARVCAGRLVRMAF